MIAKWSTWTLQRQVTVIVLVIFFLTEVVSAGLGAVSVWRNHYDTIRHVGSDFVIEALPAIAAAPPAARPAVAGDFFAAYRTVRISTQPGAFGGRGITEHPRFAQTLAAQMEERGVPIAELRVAERQVETKDLDGPLFRAIPDLTHTGHSLRVLEGRDIHATLTALAVRLAGEQDWINFYTMSAPLRWSALILSSAVETALGLALLVVLLLIIRQVMRPLRRLAHDAEAIGRGEDAGAIEGAGSADVRETIDAFNRMRERISQSFAYQSAMLQSLGHDVRGPLSGVRRLAEAAPPGVRDPLLARLASVEDVVRSITSFSRATRRDGAISRVDLHSLLEVLVEEQLDQGHEANLQASVGPIVRGRHNALERLVRNLIENAVKYGGCARVRLTRSDRSALIEIEDDGPGIAPDMIEAAFRPFERLDAKGPGTGLGLAIAKAIAVDHGGTLTLHNRAPIGLRAVLRLPLEPEHV